ncbi:MAG: hypothetical protein HXS44_14520 [Theionarchaea archaeon]|nr:hypothetical protein [Theionarchaea archaeon]
MKNDSHPADRKETIRQFTMITLLVLSFNLISVNISYLSLTSLRFFGFILLLITFIALFPFSTLNQYTLTRIQENKESRDNTIMIGIVILASILLFATSSRIYWILSFGIFIFGLKNVSKSRMDKEITLIMAGTLLYIFVFMVSLSSPFVYRSISSLSLQLTQSLGEFIEIPMSLGPSSSGFWIWMFFVLCIIALFIQDIRTRQTLQTLILYLCGSFILWVVSLLCYSFVFSQLEIEPLSAVTLLQLALFFMLDGLFFVGLRKTELSPFELKFYTKRWRRTGVLLLLFVSVVLLTVMPYVGRGETGKIVFYERDCSMGSYIPEFPEEGEPLTGDQGISFGATLWYFAERGYSIERLDDENPKSLEEALQDADVFIVANLNSPLPYEECEIIHAFVRNGGGLLVFGEHTNMMADIVDFQSGHHYLNDILYPTGIRVNTDTAEWMAEHWQTSQDFAPHAVVRGLSPEDIRTGSVGASLSISGSAQPIIVGRYAFSDKENPLEPGYLGDREYARGEQLGDIILAASDTYGKGKVLAFGDTSFGFNEALTGTWKLMENSIHFLTREGTSPYLGWAALLFFTLMVALLYVGDTLLKVLGYSILFVALLVSGVISMAVKPPHAAVDTIAWLDNTHCNLINTRGYKDNSVDGLSKNLMRNVYIPLFLDDVSQLQEGSVFVIIAPTRKYSSGEAKEIASFVEKGGLLIMSVGFNEKYAVQPLLDIFQMDIWGIPLGPVPWIIETHGRTPQISDEDLDKYWHEPKFMEVYPVAGASPCMSYASLTYLGQTYDLIISRQYGQGMVVLIGDSRFLLDENLEYSLDPARLGKPLFAALWAGNIELLKDVITDYKEGLQ